jgi:hypothetical protein
MAGLLSKDGYLNLTAVSGSTQVGLYAADGSYNVTTSGTGYRGLFAPCGALNITAVTGSSWAGMYAPDGSLNVYFGDGSHCGCASGNDVLGTLTVPYKIATNRLRTPIGSTTPGGGINYSFSSVYLGTAPYSTYGYRFGFPAHQSASGNYPVESRQNGTFTILGFSLGYGMADDVTQATWIRGTINGSQSAIIDPTVNPIGVLSDELIPFASQIPANAHRWLRVSVYFAGASLLVNAAATAPSREYAKFHNSDNSVWLTNGANLTLTPNGVSSSAYTASLAVCKGSGTRRAYFVFGDSIGYGQNEGQAGFSDGIWGYLSRGLEDRTTPANVRFGLNWCCPGTKATDVGAHNDTLQWKAGLIKLLPNIPFDAIICQHMTNDSFTSLATGITNMKAYYAALRTLFGASIPIYQATLTPKIAALTDAYATTANQTPAAYFNNGQSERQLNDKIKADLLDGVLTGYIDAGSAIADGVSTDKCLSLTSPSTTLNGDYTQNSTTMNVVDASIFSPGDWLFPDPVYGGQSGTGSYTGQVMSITGNAITLVSGINNALLTSGKIVRTAYLSDGVHPTRAGHKLMAPVVTAWRDAQVLAGY